MPLDSRPYLKLTASLSIWARLHAELTDEQPLTRRIRNTIAGMLEDHELGMTVEVQPSGGDADD